MARSFPSLSMIPEMNMMSEKSLVDNNFIFDNYQLQQQRPFHLSCSSSSSSLPYNDFLDYDAGNSEDRSLGLFLDVEAAVLTMAAPDVDSNSVFAGKPLEGTTEGKLGAKNGKKKKKKKKGEEARKHRYEFQTRSQVDILDDGYRWRKYGQKAVKSNKFPRSYYRCTNQGCGVKKQVQRLTKDEGVVVTTYVGIHSHTIKKSTDDFEHILGQLHIYGNNTDAASS